MVIYSQNLHEKLFGYAISREFIKYQSPFCDLLDDPTLALDFDLSINCNQALNGNLSARENFTNTLILCSTDIDVSTLEFYRHKMETYPIFHPEISRINYTFANLNRLPSDNGGFIDKLKNAVKNCLNSPCNLFTPMSNSVGKLTRGTLFASENTVLAVGSLKDSMATFTGGIDDTIFNKIPQAFQQGITNLKLIGKNAWSESQAMLTKESLPELIAKAQRGESLRTNTAGYRYTPDLKSYLDLNSLASSLLGGVASDMGDCFRRYQQASRYNPYDPAQNQSGVSLSPLADTSNGLTPNSGDFDRTLLGQSILNTGGSIGNNLDYNSIGNKQTLKISEGTYVTDYFNFSGNGANTTTIYGGWIDIQNNTFYLDTTVDKYTYVGQIASSNYLVGPMGYNSYKDFVNKGYIDSTDLVNYEEKKFNLGFAINLTSLANYLNADGKNSYTTGALSRLLRKTGKDDKRIYAEITPAGGSPIFVKMFDIAGSENRIDMTIPTFKAIFKRDPVKQRAVGDAAKYDGFNVYTYGHPPTNSRVRFIVGKLSDVTV